MKGGPRSWVAGLVFEVERQEERAIVADFEEDLGRSSVMS
jgi:hypothetical protein